MNGDSVAMIENFGPASVTELDVREMMTAGEEPLPRILELADALPPGRVLHVRTQFQPLVVFREMAERGFECWSASFGEDDWSSWFWWADHPPTPEEPTPAPQPLDEDVVDLRSMAPPEPLLWIMDWIGDAATSDVLRVALPRYPAPLEALLAGSGWLVAIDTERSDGVVVRIAAG